MPLSDGEEFAGYTILKLLGSGGMGEVYLAQHPRLPRRDALKILAANLTTDNEFRQRFSREADLAAGLSHPHIVGIHDRGEFQGQLWISMEYVEGTDAAALLRSRYPSGMPRAEAVEIITAVADALDYAHSRGLLHRDIKPANILLGEAAPGRRRILLADFGIARQVADISGLTATNMMVGTTAYSAPEQLRVWILRRASRPICPRVHGFSIVDRVGAVSSLPILRSSSPSTCPSRRRLSASADPNWWDLTPPLPKRWPKIATIAIRAARISQPHWVSNQTRLRQTRWPLP